MLKFRKVVCACLLSAGLLNSGCFKSKNVVSRVPPVGGQPVVLNGVPYALPRTVVAVRVSVKRVDKKPGEVEEYTPCFFSKEIAGGRVTAESKAFSLETPTFTSRGEPDPNEHYIAKIKGGYFENKTLLLEFNPDGVITKGEASSENTAIDVAIKGARAAISVGANIAKAAAATPPGSPTPRRLTFAEETALQAAQIEICRSQIVAEAAANAAAKAKATAKAIGVGSADADTAGNEAKEAEAKVETAKATLTNAASTLRTAFPTPTPSPTPTTPQEDAVRDLQGISEDPQGTDQNLLARVVEDAKVVKQKALDIAAALGANDKAKVLRDAAAKIDEAINLTDKSGALAGVFRNGYLEAKKQYEQLVALKERRQDVSVGDGTPQDTLKLLLDQFDAAISSQQNTFFFGTQSEDTWSGDFRFTPGKSVLSAGGYNTSQASPALFLFSKEQGLCETAETAKQGVLIKDNFKADTCPLPAEKSEAIWVRVDRLPDDDGFLGQMAAANARDESKGERGFYYRIPAMALVKLEAGSLTDEQLKSLEKQSLDGRRWRQDGHDTPPPATPLMPDGKEVARSMMKVAQLGVTASLPASAAGRKTQYTIDFDENTGAMKNFKLASNALLEKSIVDEASGAANDIIGAKEARDKARTDAAKAEAEANDPLNQKKRELELLKTQNQINEEKKKLAETQPPSEQ